MGKFGKLAFLLTTMAFQLQAITVFITNGYFGNTVTSDGQAVLAFNIIAFLGLLTAEVFLAEVHLAKVKLGEKLINILAMLILLGAAACILISIAIFGSNSPNNANLAMYPFTTFCTAIAASTLGGIFVLLDLCCGGRC